jgi:AhpD family alkylhydroperoxidase
MLLPPIDPRITTGATADVLAAVARRWGRVPNAVRVLAHSEAAVTGWWAFEQALAGVDPARRERLALLAAEVNACAYCRSLHGATARLAGLDAADIAAARAAGAPGHAPDAAALAVAAAALDRADLDGTGAAAAADGSGLTPAEVVEVLAAVALDTLHNLVNRAAATPLDPGLTARRAGGGSAPQ